MSGRDDDQGPLLLPTGEGAPKFGRLILLLACAVGAIAALTFGAAAYYS